MSKTIDQRVVEMQFDNRHFEKNVQTSLSTLDKLKQSLNFKGASDGLNSLNTAANRCNMSGLNSGIESVNAKFSAMQVIGMTALANITNSAVNAGKRITKALTIDPVMTGFREYETQINSVQTILANTQHAGTNIEQVNAALDELNTYADKTIYNFTEMTRNIGTFTAAGVDLDKSVQSIKGIANLAAVSGSTSQQASTAMYQLSQALAAGKVSLMDWNSVVNAGMGGKVFQDALVRTSELLKTGAKDAIDMYGSFRESLTKGEWLTTEVLTETLAQLSGAYTKADLIAQGYTEKQAQEIVDLAQTAEDAATKVKTFTQLFDTLKESAQSGWTQTWELIIGDFDEAKETMTKLSDTFGNIINKMSDARNSFLSGALTSNWDKLTQKIEKAGISAEVFDKKLTETLKENGIEVEDLVEKYGSLKKAFQKGKVPANMLTKTLKKLVGVKDDAANAAGKVTKATEELGKIVDDVINGKFGDGAKRIKALTEAGYDYATVQNLVNEKLGSSVRHLSSLSEEQIKTADQMSKLSDAQLKNKGYTEEQIQALRELEKAASDGGTSINELINSIEKPSGRELLWDSLFNIFEAIGKVVGTIKEAWNEVFKDENTDKSKGLYDLIESFNKLTESMIISDEAAANFKKVMEGLFGIFDLSMLVASKTLVNGFKVLLNVLSLFGTDLGDILGLISDYIIKVRDWVKENTIFMGMLDKISAILYAVIEGLINMGKAFASLETVKTIIKEVKEAFEKLFNIFKLDFKGFAPKDIVAIIQKAFEDAVAWIKGLDGSDAARNFMTGLANGFISGIEIIANIIKNIATMVIETICDIWDEHSPSREAEKIGENFMVGLYNGLKDGSLTIWDALKEFGLKCLEILSKIDYGQVFAGGIIVGTLLIFKQLVDAIQIFTKPVEALSGMLDKLGGMFSSIGSAIKGVGTAVEKYINAKTWGIRSKAILNFAIAIGILAASMAVLAFIPYPQLIKAGVAIGVMAGLIAGLLVLTSKLNKVGELTVSATTIMGIAASLVIIAIAMNKMASIDPDGMKTAIVGMTVAIGSLFGLLAVMDAIMTPGTELTIVKMGWMLIKMSVAFLAMSAVIKIAATISGNDVARASGVMTLVSVLFIAFIAVSKLAGSNASKAGGMLMKMSLAFMIMVGVIKLAAGLNSNEVTRGIGIITLVGALFAAFIAVSKFAGQYGAKAGIMLLTASAGLMIMVQVVEQAASIDPADVNRGLKVVAGLELLFAGLMVVSNFAGKNAIKAGTMLLLISGALLVLTGVIFILSNIDPSGLKNAVIAISILGIVFGGLIAVTKLANGCEKEILKLTIAIGMLSMVLIALTFIDAKKLVPAVAAITTVISAFALLIGITKFANATKGMNIMLIEMTVIVGILTGIVILLAKMDAGRALEATVSLSILMLSFATSLSIISKISNTSKIAITQVGIMLGIIAGLAAILGVLAYLEVEPSIQAAIAIGILLNAMAVALNLLKMVSPTANAAIGSLALLGLVVAELGIILGLFAKFNIAPSIETAASLSILLIALSGSLILLGAAGTFGPAVFIGIGALAAMIAGVGTLMIAIGALVDHFPKLETFLDKGIVILEKIGYGLGSFLGNMVGGFTKGITAGLPAIGSDLSAFMTNAQPFFDGLDGVNEAAVNSVKTIAQMILILTAANIVESIGRWLGAGDNSLIRFGQELSAFGPLFANYANSIAGIDGSAVEASSNAAKSLAEFAAAVPNMGGLAAFFAGENSLVTFGKELAAFGPHIKAYSDSVKGIDSDAVTSSAAAAKTLAEFANNVPNMGGLASVFAGENDLAVFAEKLVPFGKSIKAYSEAVTGMDADAVSESAKAAKALVKVADAIPNSGGVAAFFAGDNELTTFAAEMVSFGKKLTEYSNAVSGISTDAIDASVKSAKTLVKFINSIADIETSGVKPFVKAINELGKSSVENFINAFTSSTTKLNTVGGEMVTSVSGGIQSKQSVLTNSANNSVNGMVTTLRSANSRFQTAGEQTMSSYGTGISSGGPRATAAMSTTLTGMVGSVRGNYSNFSGAGSYLVEGFSSGISAKTFLAEAKAKLMASSALTAARKALRIESPSKETYEDGEYFVEGFANAIDDNESEAYDAGFKMAKASNEGLEDGLKDAADIVEANGKEVVSAQAKVYKSITEAQEEHWQKVRENRNKAQETELKEVENYYDTLDSTTDTFMEKNSLFSAVSDEQTTSTKSDKKKIDKTKELTDNLRNQIEQLNRYKDVMMSLRTKLDGTMLGDAVSKMGMESLEELEALNKMTSKQLDDYVHLYEDKYASARGAAMAQIEGLGHDLASTQNYELLKFQQDILDETNTILAEYTDELDRNTESLMNRSGIFDEVNEQEAVTAKQLTENLQDQIDQMVLYTGVMANLQTKLGDTSLWPTISEMGVSSLAELSALDSMTEAQLDDYVALYESKFALAKEAAGYQLTELQKETEKKLGDLFGGANVDLEEFMNYFNGEFASINDYVMNSTNIGTEIANNMALGISTNSEVVKEETVDAVDEAVSKGEKVAKAEGPKIGEDLVIGFANGIKDNEHIAVAAGREVAAATAEAMKAELDEHSPSRVGYKIGDYFGIGFVNGIADNISKAYNTSGEMASYATEGLRKAISKITDLIDNGIETEPTIRPVLDLSNVEAGASRLNALFSRTQAMSISADMKNKERTEESQNGEETPKAGNSYSFVQNNYSPKALSRPEIYRQTKNQFSALKGLVET